jgi:DNA-binding winged helix-turn-helix (wHTH) protein/tetratricopeptide (TPR) repeat protein
MDATEYQFGRFRLMPATRELWLDGAQVHVPRRGFDCLTYLVEHRDRAVGRDELVAALWGRVDATDAQVNQVVLRARIAVGDDGQVQQAIRTVPGFGYRWVLPVEITVGAHSRNNTPIPDTSALPLDEATAPGVEDQARSTAADVVPRTWRRTASLIAAAALLCLVALAVLFATRARLTSPPAAAATAVVVLPLVVNAQREAGWVRLGAMDLIADRLRDGGLSVPPSDSVVSALHAVGEPLDANRLATLQQTLGAGLVVRGSATKSPTGWKVELMTSAADGVQHREASEHADVTEAARRAADVLLAALGHAQPREDVEDIDLQERLQQAQAALLANQLDTAGSVLDNTPEPMRSDPQLRAKLAQVDFRAGKLDQAKANLAVLLADPSTAAQPRAFAQALTTRGFIDIRGEDCASAEQHFDKAMSVLDPLRPTREANIALAARGLARACQGKFDDAATDLGKARTRLDAAGDRLGIARVNNYLGVLHVKRNRLADAVPYFLAAADANESFGVVEAMRANLTALLITQMHLLRWQDAWATSERLWALRTRISDPDLALLASGLRAEVLAALGRFQEAAAILAEADKASPNPQGSSARYLYQARTELAWRQGQLDLVATAAAKALAAWPTSPNADDDERTRIALLQQRASIATGHAAHAQSTAAAPTTFPVPLFVADAEWAATQGHDDEAERTFHSALAAADANGVPDMIALVADAYARWLLARGRVEDAGALSGRVASWADGDFDCALLQVAVFHADARLDAWTRALHQAQELARERMIPAGLRAPPTPR